MGADDTLYQRFGKTVPAGTVLFREGESGNQMFVILSGKVRISKRIGDVEKPLAILPAGEFFGEMAILNNEPRSATAEVVEESKLLVIDPKTFEAMIKGNSEIAIRMIKKLAARLRQANEQIENLMIKDDNCKVINTIARTSENEGEEVEGGIKVGLTAMDISLKTGLEHEKVKEIIGKLVRARLVTMLPDGLIVSDPAKLRKFIDFLTLKEQFGEI